MKGDDPLQTLTLVASDWGKFLTVGFIGARYLFYLIHLSIFKLIFCKNSPSPIPIKCCVVMHEHVCVLFPHVTDSGDSCAFGSGKYYALCGFGGILSCGITHTAVVPLDLVKCRLQVCTHIRPFITVWGHIRGEGSLTYDWSGFTDRVTSRSHSMIEELILNGAREV